MTLKYFTWMSGLIILFCCLVWALRWEPAHAQEVKSGAWSDAPQYERDWLGTQHSRGGMSCCGLGDAINVDILGEDGSGIALKVTNPRGRTELSVGQVLHANPESIVPVNLDPDGNAIAWVSYAGVNVYCLSGPWGT